MFYSAARTLAVRGEQRRRRVDTNFLPECLELIDRGTRAADIARVRLLQHPLRPGGAAILRAPDSDRFHARARMNGLEWEKEGVDRHVRDALQLLFELATVGAERIGKDDQLAAAVAADGFYSEIERQRVEIDGVQVIPARGRQILARFRVDQPAGENQRAGVVRVD